ncbi:MAG: hypothetical protein PVJ57_05280 [Phycisphaerae bacterium]|jgi:hypothetical protein
MAEKQRNVVLGSIAVIALLVALYMFFGFGSGRQRPDTYTIQGLCLGCQQEVKLSFAAGEREPYECPQCRQMAVYPWLYCYECQKLFIPNLVRGADGEPLRYPGHPACPACRTQHVGSYVPELPTQKPTGKLPPPEWSP